MCVCVGVQYSSRACQPGSVQHFHKVTFRGRFHTLRITAVYHLLLETSPGLTIAIYQRVCVRVCLCVRVCVARVFLLYSFSIGMHSVFEVLLIYLSFLWGADDVYGNARVYDVTII